MSGAVPRYGGRVKEDVDTNPERYGGDRRSAGAPGMEVERPEFRHHVSAHEHVLHRQRARMTLEFARIGSDVTLKRLQRIDAETVELQPVSTNPEHEPIEIGPTTADIEIVGVVVGAIVGTRRALE